jgi:hypothetical protein
VLAADLDAAAEELREGRDGHQASTHLRAAPPAAGDGAPHHQRVVIDGKAARGELGLELGEPIGSKHRLHHRLVGALPDLGRAGARAGQHRERPEDDGLSRARLAGHHAQSGAELELDSLHQGELLDPEQLDHPAPHPSLVRSTSKRDR